MNFVVILLVIAEVWTVVREREVVLMAAVMMVISTVLVEMLGY